MIGARVRLAREACHLTQQALADAAGITQAAVSHIEGGRVTSPSEDVIQAIARATQFPAAFFRLGPIPDLPEGNYRRLARGTSKVDKQVKAQVLHVWEVVTRAEGRMKLPPVVVEPIRSLDSVDDLEHLAVVLRRTLGLEPDGPILNVVRAVERAGVIVVRLPGEMKSHDGYSTWPDFGFGGRPIIAITAGHPGDRDRFTVAHEFAHLVLHTARPNVEPKQAEIEAHRLAGALLLPKRSALSEMKGKPVTLRTLMEIKAKYGISIAATARRAYDLSLISQSQFQSIYKQLSARRWRRDEPVDVAGEKPLLVCKVIETLGGEGGLVERANRIPMAVFTLRAVEAA